MWIFTVMSERSRVLSDSNLWIYEVGAPSAVFSIESARGRDVVQSNSPRFMWYLRVGFLERKVSCHKATAWATELDSVWWTKAETSRDKLRHQTCGKGDSNRAASLRRAVGGPFGLGEQMQAVLAKDMLPKNAKDIFDHIWYILKYFVCSTRQQISRKVHCQRHVLLSSMTLKIGCRTETDPHDPRNRAGAHHLSNHKSMWKQRVRYVVKVTSIRVSAWCSLGRWSTSESSEKTTSLVTSLIPAFVHALEVHCQSWEFHEVDGRFRLGGLRIHTLAHIEATM